MIFKPIVLSNRFPLGFFPTPLERLNNLSRNYPGYDIFIKRDDQTGLATGGNKTRKLEYLIFDALEKGSDTVMTAGAQQSNHCRQTAAAAAKAGLKCVLLLGGDPPEKYLGNLLLSKLLGAEIVFTGENRKGEDLPKYFDDFSADGRKPYIIPYGGSNQFGALGYFNATLELKNQLAEMNETVDFIFFATSSGGTHAGLQMGKSAFQMNYELIGVNIDKVETYEIGLERMILRIIDETQKLTSTDFNFSDNELSVIREYDSQGYGIVTGQEINAIKTLAESEGILLDPVYTARAFTGMLDYLRNEKIPKGSNVLFWHTGGTTALFDNSKWELK